jgi:DegV family protein with EDD domain
MPKITIVTDTNSSLPHHISSKHNIVQVPIHIQFGDKSYITGEDINDERLFKIIDEQNVLPTTAAPSPSAFKEAFQAAFENKADQVICICCSSEVSATYNAAVMASELFPERDISVVDSRQLCLAEGFQVLHAAKAAEKGMNKEEILNMIQDLQERTHVFGALPTLKYLAMGGRVGKLAAGFADTFNIKPILTSRDGNLELLEKVRTWRKARERLIELAAGCTDGKDIQEIGLIHVNNKEGVVKLHEMLAEKLSLPETALTAEFTPGLSVHTGSGVIGFVLVTN